MDARTSIEEIIKQDAAFCREVSVTINRGLPTVVIKDESEMANDDIFMQGEDAEQFVQALDGLIEEAPNVSLDEALKHLALPHVECIWN